MESGEVVHQDANENELREQQEGQGLAEYALILALIAVIAIAALFFLGGSINELMDTIGNTIDDKT